MFPENKAENPLFGKDFLKSWYLSDDEIKSVVNAAERLSALYKNGYSVKTFESGAAVLITNSGREAGMELAAQFGCALSGLSLCEKSGRDFGNSATLATLLAANCADVVAVRDCEYVGKSSGYMRRLAACVKQRRRTQALRNQPRQRRGQPYPDPFRPRLYGAALRRNGAACRTAGRRHMGIRSGCKNIRSRAAGTYFVAHPLWDERGARAPGGLRAFSERM